MSLDVVVDRMLVLSTIDCLVKGVVECDKNSGNKNSPVEAGAIDAYRCEYNTALRSGSFNEALPGYFKRIIPLILGNPVGKKTKSVFSFAKTWAGATIAFGVLSALTSRPPLNESVALMAVGGVAYFSFNFVEKYFSIQSRRAWNRRCSSVLYAGRHIWQEAVANLYNNRDSYETFREKQNA